MGVSPERCGDGGDRRASRGRRPLDPALKAAAREVAAGLLRSSGGGFGRASRRVLRGGAFGFGSLSGSAAALGRARRCAGLCAAGEVCARSFHLLGARRGGRGAKLFESLRHEGMGPHEHRQGRARRSGPSAPAACGRSRARRPFARTHLRQALPHRRDRGRRVGRAFLDRRGRAARSPARRRLRRRRGASQEPRRELPLAPRHGGRDRALDGGRLARPGVASLARDGDGRRRKRRSLRSAQKHSNRLRDRRARHGVDAALRHLLRHGGGVLPGLGRRPRAVSLHDDLVRAERAAHRGVRADGDRLSRQASRIL